MSTNDCRLSVVPGRSDENPAGIYRDLEDAIRELHAVSNRALLQALKMMKMIDPTYARRHELHGEVGEPPSPPREARLAYEQMTRLHDIRQAINSEVVELDKRLYGRRSRLRGSSTSGR